MGDLGVVASTLDFKGAKADTAFTVGGFLSDLDHRDEGMQGEGYWQNGS
jgi:hypothetical protein